MSSKFQASQAKPMFDPTNHRPNNPPNNSSNFLKATRQQINVHKQTTTNTKERSVDRPRQQPEAIYDHSRGSNGINYVGTRTRRLNERRQMNNRRTRHRISVFFSMFIGPRYPLRRLHHHGHPRFTRPRRVSRFASGIVLSPHNVRDRYLAGYRQCIAFHGCTSPFSFFFYALSTSSASTCLEKRVHTYGRREVC